MRPAEHERTILVAATRNLVIAPACAVHAGSRIRRYRTHGPRGPGVYPQCVPQNGDTPHLLAWPDEAVLPADDPWLVTVSAAEIDILNDAAAGLTMLESAQKRAKGIETVKTQRKKLLVKLDARNMTHAVAVAIHSGLIATPSQRRCERVRSITE
jgi:DNA-binding CsgD family transcriptional regulator